jgi:hypothetical protein
MNPILALSGAAFFGGAPLERGRETRETPDGRAPSIWREQLAEMLGAQLVNLDAMVHGFTAPRVRRRNGLRAYSTLD